MHRRANRRVFLKRAAGSAGGMIILQSSRSASGAPANTKLRVAIIGCGGRGKTFVDSMPSMENVVALCDVNQERAAQSFKQLPSAKRYGDFREMLDEMGKQIDAVVVATPDHTHAVASAAAIRAGKHVYTEKPLTRTVRESRVLRELAAKSKVATSMGNQGTASGPFRRALELIRGGVLGTHQRGPRLERPGRGRPPQAARGRGARPARTSSGTCGSARRGSARSIRSGWRGTGGATSARRTSATGPRTRRTWPSWP